MIPNYTPYARETLPGERRPITYSGGEWMSEFPRPSITGRLTRALAKLVVVGCAVGVALCLLGRFG